MISTGKIYKALVKYFDMEKGIAFKFRPVLILAKADAADFVVLPVSTVSRKENLNKYYDVMVDPEQYPLVNLNKVSYVRTHKQIIVHIAEITGEIGDLKANYSDLYSEILSKRSDFSDEITRQALENMKMRVK